MTDTATTDTAQTNSPKPVAAPKRKSSLPVLFLVCFNLLLLSGLAGLGFLYREQQKSLTVLFADYNSLGQQGTTTTAGFAAAEAARAQLQQALDMQKAETAEQLAAQAQQLDEAQRELVSMRLRISEASGGGNQGWMLTEAESLLRLARTRLLSARDIRTAISLYMACDDLLRQINDPAVHSVREILLGELDTLRAVVLPDVPLVYERIGAVAAQLDSLNLSSENSGNDLEFTAPAGEPATAETGWFDSLSASLGQYFVIKRQDSPVQPQLSPEQTFMTQQIIRLHLEEARAALLHEETRLYLSALDAASGDIDMYLQGADKVQILAAIAQLRDMPILAVIPPTGSTLNALRQIAPAVPVATEGLDQ